MPIWTPRLVASRPAKQYADLFLIKNDLEQVVKCCRRLVGEEIDPLGALGMALLDSALIRYRRCFNRSVRTRLGFLVDQLSDSDRALHQLVLHLADMHIAHSANDYEWAVATVHTATGDDGQLMRGGIGAQIHQTVALSPKQLKQLCNLACSFGMQIGARSQKLVEKLTGDVAKMTDADLSQLPDAVFPTGIRNASQNRSWPPKAEGEIS